MINEKKSDTRYHILCDFIYRKFSEWQIHRYRKLIGQLSGSERNDSLQGLVLFGGYEKILEQNRGSICTEL